MAVLVFLAYVAMATMLAAVGLEGTQDRKTRYVVVLCAVLFLILSTTSLLLR